MSNNYYAVIQLGYSILGSGESAEAATDDAHEWVDGDMNLVDENQAVDGDLVLVKCTKALHDEVKENGGDVFYTLLESGLYGLESGLYGLDRGGE
jgi:hypothetical protein